MTRRVIPILLATLVVTASGCAPRSQSGSHAAPAAAAAPAAPPGATASHAPVAVMRAFAGAARETSLTPAEPPPPEPTAHYASLEAARDVIEAMLRRAVPARDTAIHFRRESVAFDYMWVKASARGLAVHVVVNDTTACPHEKLLDAMRTAGWVDHWSYSADGADGSDMGLVCRQFLCLVEATWVGGDESDTTFVPPPGCEVKVTVVPRRLDDTPDR
jgi:hypothetical protein